jgi:hypothetical protein
MDILDKTEAIADDLKRYFSTRVELIKLETLDKSSEVGAGVVSRIIVSTAAIFALLFLSVWLSFYLSTLIGIPYSGFGIVGGFYTLIFLILLVGRKSLLENPIRNGIIAGAELEEVGEIEKTAHEANHKKQNAES